MYRVFASCPLPASDSCAALYPARAKWEMRLVQDAKLQARWLWKSEFVCSPALAIFWLENKCMDSLANHVYTSTTIVFIAKSGARLHLMIRLVHDLKVQAKWLQKQVDESGTTYLRSRQGRGERWWMSGDTLLLWVELWLLRRRKVQRAMAVACKSFVSRVECVSSKCGSDGTMHCLWSEPMSLWRSLLQLTVFRSISWEGRVRC